MIISPPFLSLADMPVYDAASVRAMMPGGVVGHGGFPVSMAMGWHGGIHLKAPAATEPVRAIADGIVVYRRDNRPVHYEGVEYSTGCVVIRHTTDIGATQRVDAAATATTVTYYSITLHLASLDHDLPATNQPIWRKDRLGLAGKIRGEDEQIHFEIVCGDEDIQSLVGRRTGRLALEQDGRFDALYGTVYVFVPRGAALHAAQPTAAHVAPSSATTEDLVIGIQYTSGDARLLTWRLAGGEPVGSLTEPDKSEYRLYQQALDRHRERPTDSSPSGWQELLRLGRKLGPDPLPANAPHWRRIQLPDGSTPWIDLNAAPTRKYSDADFPQWQGWRLVDDDVTDNDSRCDSRMVARFLNTTAEGQAVEADTPQTRMNRLVAADVQEKLSRTICKFPTEWAKADVQARWQWVQEAGNPYNPTPMNASTFERFVAFAQTLCFWEELPEADRQRLTKKHWHFHPREFIVHLRKCGWLSKSELTQMFPVKALRNAGERGWALEDVRPNDRRIARNLLHLNSATRRYGITTAQRLAAFYGNAMQETQWFDLLAERDGNAKRYAPWFGRGFMQLTWPNNYIKYWRFRGRVVNEQLASQLNDAARQADRQRTNAPLRALEGSISAEVVRWREGFLADEIQNITPSDSAGAYWAWTRASESADAPAPFVRVVQPVQIPSNSHASIYYTHHSFGNVAATVNMGYPSTNYGAVYGVQARFQAYTAGIVILGDSPAFADATGQMHDTPEGWSRRVP